MAYKFTKPFRGATGTDPFPIRFEIGEDCPDDLVAAALEADAIEDVDAAPLPDMIDANFHHPADVVTANTDATFVEVARVTNPVFPKARKSKKG